MDEPKVIMMMDADSMEGGGLQESLEEAAGEGTAIPRNEPLDAEALHLPAQQAKSLLRMLRSAAAAMREDLELHLPCTFQVEAAAVRALSLSEVLNSLPEFCTCAVMDVDSGVSAAWLVWDPVVIHPLLEVELGGQLRAARVLRRDLTGVEEDLMAAPVEIAVRAISSAAQSAGQPEFRFASLGNRSVIEQLCSMGDHAVLEARFAVTVGDKYSGSLQWIFPQALLARLSGPRPPQASPSLPVGAQAAERTMAEILAQAEVSVEAQLCSGRVVFRELLNLRVGSVLAFNSTLDMPVRCLLNRLEYFEGRIVRHGSRLGFQVQQRTRGRGAAAAQQS